MGAAELLLPALPEIAMVRSLLQDGGFEPEHTWTDRRKWFALHLARVTKSCRNERLRCDRHRRMR